MFNYEAEKVAKFWSCSASHFWLWKKTGEGKHPLPPPPPPIVKKCFLKDVIEK